ncbi:hypothetical protein [Hymenobacter sp. BT190]|uniref:hypothetical protein n=1 Tax=Hymenobacter sp. BT190 TaxID=2763505 RepID=UPI0016516219|nr:hypothetical protein [Hymenobacter sp. BT190]MBC6699816.1 hypothetical protein [Hymenobacter sp. BT190]
MLRTILLVALLAAACPSFCQQRPDSTALTYSPAAWIRQDYYKDQISLTKLYNGAEYIDYTKLYAVIKGHQFFLSDQKLNGSITYDNHLFNDVKIAYDIARNQVVVQHATNPFTLKLINKNIQNFTIDGHYFQRIEADSSNQTVVRTGFYELLSDKSFRIFAQRKKGTLERIDQQKVTLEFMPETRLYLEKSGIFYDINSKKNFILAIGSQGDNLKKYIKSNKLKFDMKRRESSVISTVNYFEQLSQ